MKWWGSLVVGVAASVIYIALIPLLDGLGDRLRRERDQARREATEEHDQARQERDRLLGLIEATQKLLEDQSRERRTKER
ncbi:MAG: hypothetical protein V3S40_06375 [Kiloniellales bacterium]